MSVFVQGRVPRSWNDETVSHITRRLIALERELAGGRDRFLSPSIPSFGSGTVSGGAGATSPAAVEVPIDDGQESQAPVSEMRDHVHDIQHILGLIDEIMRLVGQPSPHLHSPENPADAQAIIAGQTFGG